MQYRIDSNSGNELSILGLGCMRLPTKMGQIHIEKAESIVMEAVRNGINYFDTAFFYKGSEEALGMIVKKNNLRNKIYISTKLPLSICNSYEDFDKLFKIQLNRLQTDYIDYYLMHHLSDIALWNKLCALGIEKWIAEKKENELIKHIGFSFHGKQNEFFALLDAYDWQFCYIQYNYININYQAGRAGMMKAAEKGISIFVMEPLLGGRLATALPPKAERLFKSVNNLTPAAWGLRWLWNQEQITVVLSGMSDIFQLRENAAIAGTSTPKMLNTQENEIYRKVVDVFNESYKIVCTGCNYCMPCPQHVNIPGCFIAYNLSYTIGKFQALPHYVTSIGGIAKKLKYSPSQCIKCGKCEKKCPQGISIMSDLQIVKKRMEPIWVKFILSFMMKQREKHTQRKRIE